MLPTDSIEGFLPLSPSVPLQEGIGQKTKGTSLHEINHNTLCEESSPVITLPVSQLRHSDNLCLHHSSPWSTETPSILSPFKYDHATWTHVFISFPHYRPCSLWISWGSQTNDHIRSDLLQPRNTVLIVPFLEDVQSKVVAEHGEVASLQEQQHKLIS